MNIIQITHLCQTAKTDVSPEILLPCHNNESTLITDYREQTGLEPALNSALFNLLTENN